MIEQPQKQFQSPFMNNYSLVNTNGFKLHHIKEVIGIDYNKLSIDILKDKEKHDHFAKVARKALWNKKMNIDDKFVRFKIVDKKIV